MGKKTYPGCEGKISNDFKQKPLTLTPLWYSSVLCGSWADLKGFRGVSVPMVSLYVYPFQGWVLQQTSDRIH